jgi:hypothetical protein
MRRASRVVVVVLQVAAAAALVVASVSCGSNSTQTTRPAENPTCAVADAPRNAGADRAARRAYVAVLKREPKKPCATVGLKAITSPPPAHGFSHWVGHAEGWSLVWAKRLAYAAGLVALVLFVLLLVGRWRPAKGVLLRIPFVRPILNPGLSVGQLDDSAVDPKVGAALAGRIKECLSRYRSQAIGEPRRARPRLRRWR